MKRATLAAAFAVSAAVVAGCGRDVATSEMQAADYMAAGSAKAASAPATMGMAGGQLGGAAPQAGDAPGQARLPQLQGATADRYLIRQGAVTLEAADVRKAAAAITRAATEAGGYVADGSEVTDPIQGVAVTLLLRVPAARFDAMTSQVTALGRLIDKRISAEDVTEEYIDSDARVRNLKRTEERLLAHLGRTGRLADTLSIERELSRVRAEVEQISGRLRYLSHRIAFCTLTVTLRETARPRPTEPAESWSQKQVASEAARSLVGFARSLWSMVIWVGVWSAVWLPLAALAYWAFRRRPAPPAP